MHFSLIPLPEVDIIIRVDPSTDSIELILRDFSFVELGLELIEEEELEFGVVGDETGVC